ncbi:MAG: pectinesterase family protein, partial [Clostridia bacterium]
MLIPIPSVVGQCVALSVCGSNFVADNCIFTSTQDTLFCAPLPDDLVIRYLDFLPTNLNYIEGETVQKYINCTIVGSVDFIFGCANALFLKCNIVSINCGESWSYVVAPAHSLKQTIGFVFVECDFTSSSCSEKSVYLARPWRDFGLAS